MKMIKKTSWAVDAKTVREEQGNFFNVELCTEQISITIDSEEATLWVPPYLHPFGCIAFPIIDSIEATMVEVDSCLYELLTTHGKVIDYGNAWGFDFMDSITLELVEDTIRHQFRWAYTVSHITPSTMLLLNSIDDNIWSWRIEVWSQENDNEPMTLVNSIEFREVAETFNDIFYDGIGEELTYAIYSIVKNFK